ncbi:MAG TPA: ATPase, partial [Pasteurellaceae bacterium]|nr:ATPase [Pasteurellaceae bacterium]
NNMTSKSSQKLTALFQYNIPQRWSISHLYQAILNQETHLDQIDYLTTLAGYVHWKLSGEKVLGVGEASGMFPIDIQTQSYHRRMLSQFDALVNEKNYPWKIEQILPKVLVAGQSAGCLSVEGAALLDPDGNLQADIPMCPPEGDAGTGMVATNSIKEKTGNISAGTSAFTMIVLEKELSQVYEQLDMVTTPTGKLVAMAHANNCTTDINAWVKLFGESLKAFGTEVSTEKLYETLFMKALEGDADCGGLLSYGFYSGEHGVGLSEGCPLFIHPTNADFNLANFIRVHLYSAFGAMKLGMDILMQQEKINIDSILGHGGIFKTKNVAQKILASALNTPIATMETAGEGGAWGIALLANFLEKYPSGQSLEQYLDDCIFRNVDISMVEPDENISDGYATFMRNYKKGIAVVQAAITTGKNL